MLNLDQPHAEMGADDESVTFLHLFKKSGRSGMGLVELN